MRRLAVRGSAAVALLVVSALPAAPAGPAAAAPSGAAAPAQAVCTVDDPAMTEISGLASTATGYLAMNDSHPDAAAMKVFSLDASCRRTGAWSYPGYPNRPLDPEDMAVAPDGTVWVADVGDVDPSGRAANPLAPKRVRIALWRFRNGTASAPPFRFTYPDGPHDGEALLLATDGTPIFITKQLAGQAGIYVPTAAPDPSGNPVPLRRAGTFTPRRTGTANPFGATGQVVVTGAASSPDRRHVVVRTYSDAYEWEVGGGDVLKALTSGKPAVVPLPGEPQGEAIAYTRDGSAFVTISDQNGPAKILRYARPVPPTPTTPAKRASSKGTSPLKSINPGMITNIVIALGILGVLMVIGGILGIRAGRRRSATAGDRAGGPAGPDGTGWQDADGYPEDYPDRDGYAGEGYGRDGYPGGGYPDDGYAGQGPDRGSGGTYGAPGGVYGGGGVYGSPAAESTGSRRRGATYSSGGDRAGSSGGDRAAGAARADGGAGRARVGGEYGGSTYGSPGRRSADYGSRQHGAAGHGAPDPDGPPGRGAGGRRGYGSPRERDAPVPPRERDAPGPGSSRDSGEYGGRGSSRGSGSAHASGSARAGGTYGSPARDRDDYGAGPGRDQADYGGRGRDQADYGGRGRDGDEYGSGRSGPTSGGPRGGRSGGHGSGSRGAARVYGGGARQHEGEPDWDYPDDEPPPRRSRHADY